MNLSEAAQSLSYETIENRDEMAAMYVSFNKAITHMNQKYGYELARYEAVQKLK